MGPNEFEWTYESHDVDSGSRYSMILTIMSALLVFCEINEGPIARLTALRRLSYSCPITIP